MGWLIILAVLIVPFLLNACSRHPAARLGLLMFWLACAGGLGYLLLQAAKIRSDLETMHIYLLPNTVGVHHVEIAALSQGSIKAVLKGGAGPLSRPQLERFRWAFPERIRTTWFEPRQYDETGPGEIFLFHALLGDPDFLEYQVDEAGAELLSGRTLVVTHDLSAKHMLRDHALLSAEIAAWILGLWGGLWMIVQAVQEWRRRHPAPVAGKDPPPLMPGA